MFKSTYSLCPGPTCIPVSVSLETFIYPYFFKTFLKYEPFSKSSLNVLQYCLCFYGLFVWWEVCGSLASQPRSEPTTLSNSPWVVRWSLNHWTAREVQKPSYTFRYYKYNKFSLSHFDLGFGHLWSKGFLNVAEMSPVLERLISNTSQLHHKRGPGSCFDSELCLKGQMRSDYGQRRGSRDQCPLPFPLRAYL